MTYADNYNIRTTSVKFNDVADALDGLITRQYGATTIGTSSAYIANPTPPWQSYDAASFIVIIPHVTNAANATIQISPATNGVAAKDLRIAGSPIAAGVMQAGIPTILAYTGVYFEVLLQNVSIPAGQINPFAGSNAPVGWLLCDGNSYNTFTYRVLHSVISNVYGGTAYAPGTTDQPSAVTTFQIPDLRRRMAIGMGTSDTLGFTEGGDNTGTAYASRSMSHTHTINHTHTIPDHRHTVPAHTHGLAGHTHTINHTHTIPDHRHTVPGHVHGLASHTHTISHTHAIPNHQHTVPAHVHGLAGHTHTVEHSHPLSSAGGAKITFTSSTLFAGRDGPGNSWTATNADSTQAWGGSSSVRSDSIGLIGNTNTQTPTSSGPSSSTTSGASADNTGFSTAIGEGGVTTNSQTGTDSGGPSSSTTSGASADTTGFLTNTGEGGVTTNSQTGTNSGGPSSSTTSGGTADTTGFLTNTGEGGVTTNSQTGTNSGSTSLPYLFLNYIIKF